jgi:hypothetical protein
LKATYLETLCINQIAMVCVQLRGFPRQDVIQALKRLHNWKSLPLVCRPGEAGIIELTGERRQKVTPVIAQRYSAILRRYLSSDRGPVVVFTLRKM